MTPGRRPGGPRRGGEQIVPRPDVWRLGAPAPWPQPPAGPSSALGLDSVIAAVAGRRPGTVGGGLAVETVPEEDVETAPVDVDGVTADGVPMFAGARPSAVLVALHDGPSGAEVILTRRSWALRNHRGEISFPGGRIDDGETPEQAALREAHEEVALGPELVEVVGRLPTLATVVSLSHIVPVVARLQGRPALTPAASEVERILHVPLVDLAQPGVFHEEQWGSPPLDRAIFFFELEDETIWGATARILVDLLQVALRP